MSKSKTKINKNQKPSKRGWVRKVFNLLLVIGLVIILGTVCINLHVKSFVKNEILTVSDVSDIRADCIMVLGAGLWNSTTPSPMLGDRLRRGVELYELGVAPKMIMSGDHGQRNYDEVSVMRNFAINKGVPSSDIFMDHAGFSTYESMYRAKYIFGAKSIVIVTQGFHIERALYIAEKLGLEAYGVTSDLQDYGGIAYNQARDVLARVKDFFMVIFKPKPTYLGDKISLLGNGEITLG